MGRSGFRCEARSSECATERGRRAAFPKTMEHQEQRTRQQRYRKSVVLDCGEHRSSKLCRLGLTPRPAGREAAALSGLTPVPGITRDPLEIPQRRPEPTTITGILVVS